MQHVGTRAPWHLWLVGCFSAIFNSIGAFDYLMTMRHDAAYFEQLGYGVAQIAYFENYPLLPAIFWTVGVFGAVAASVLLLLRSRYTVPVALVALCAQVGLDVISFGLMDRLRVFGVRQSAFDILVPLELAVVLYWYAVVMSRRGMARRLVSRVIGLLLLPLVMHTIVRIIRSYYKFPMPEFLADLIDNPFRRRIQPPQQMPFRHGIEPGMSVLEVGPGNGRYTVETAQYVGPNGRVVAIDIEPKMIERVKRRIQTEGITNVDASVADV